MDNIFVEIVEISPNYIKFILNNCDVSLANALRRVMIAQVPTLAPHLINIIENTSVLHDQFLCQRIGLIPFVSDGIDNFKYPWQCSCGKAKDCQICKVNFVLQAKNIDQDVLEVTSLDIRSVYQSLKAQDQQGPRPVMPVQFESDLIKGRKIGIPLVKLAKDQQINVRFSVEKGIGKMHSKWSPVSLATFQPDPQVILDDNMQLENETKIAIKQSCPTKVFEITSNKLIVINPEKCIFCGQCKKMAQAHDLKNLKNYIRIGKKKNRYIFKVQSIGSMMAHFIVKKAISTLRQKLKQIQQRID